MLPMQLPSRNGSSASGTGQDSRAKSLTVRVGLLIAIALLGLGWYFKNQTSSRPAAGIANAGCFKVDPKHPYETPIPGFNPRTASDAELAKADFPPRPSPSDARYAAAWNGYVDAYLAGKVVHCIPVNIPGKDAKLHDGPPGR